MEDTQKSFKEFIELTNEDGKRIDGIRAPIKCVATLNKKLHKNVDEAILTVHLVFPDSFIFYPTISSFKLIKNDGISGNYEIMLRGSSPEMHELLKKYIEKSKGKTAYIRHISVRDENWYNFFINNYDDGLNFYKEDEMKLRFKKMYYGKAIFKKIKNEI